MGQVGSLQRSDQPPLRTQLTSGPPTSTSSWRPETAKDTLGGPVEKQLPDGLSSKALTFLQGVATTIKAILFFPFTVLKNMFAYFNRSSGSKPAVTQPTASTEQPKKENASNAAGKQQTDSLTTDTEESEGEETNEALRGQQTPSEPGTEQSEYTGLSARRTRASSLPLTPSSPRGTREESDTESDSEELEGLLAIRKRLEPEFEKVAGKASQLE